MIANVTSEISDCSGIEAACTIAFEAIRLAEGISTGARGSDVTGSA